MAKISTKAKKIAKEYIKSIKHKLKLERAILFGSVARGDMNKHSDIDLIIISEDFKKMKLNDRLVLLSTLRSDKFIGWPMDILGYTEEEFEKLSKISAMFSEAKKQGILIK